MATIKFLLRSKANKAVSISYYLSMGRGKFFRCNSGFSIHPSCWSISKGFPKQNEEANKRIASNLKSLEKYLLESINDAQASGIEINSQFLQAKTSECFKREKPSNELRVTQHVQYIIDHASTRKIQGRSKIGLALNTIKNYRTFKKLVENFEIYIKSTLHFIDITNELVERFKNWLLEEKKYSINHAGKSLSFLKSVSKDAEKLGIPIHPHALRIETFAEADEDRLIVTLSFDELDKIENVELKRVALDNARKWLLLGCEFGQRGDDLLNIKPSDFKESNGQKVVDVFQKKGKKHVAIGVTKRAQRILDLGFPNKILLQNFNEYLKDIGREAGLTELIEGKKVDSKSQRKIIGKYPKHELLTSHACRRSFATNYYKIIPTTLIMAITSHKKESTFLKYINKPKDMDDNALLFLKYLSKEG
jgi:integrase